MARRFIVIGAAVAALAATGLLISRIGDSHPAPVRAAATLDPATIIPPTTTTSTAPGPIPLVQTRDRPSGTDPGFAARMNLLWQAIVTGHVGDALPAFFPLAAYKVVKAVRDPASDWQHRLVAAYDADILAIHSSLHGTTAMLAGISVPDAKAVWVLPGREVNRIGYWRVYGTTLSYTVGGVNRTVGIMSLISWRGQWYVVHFRTAPR